MQRMRSPAARRCMEGKLQTPAARGVAGLQPQPAPCGSLLAGQHGDRLLLPSSRPGGPPGALLSEHAPAVGDACRACWAPTTPLAPAPTPQGYFLLRESMLDSVLVARDRFLKPGGALYPSHARMYLAPIRSNIWWAGGAAGVGAGSRPSFGRPGQPHAGAEAMSRAWNALAVMPGTVCCLAHAPPVSGTPCSWPLFLCPRCPQPAAAQ